MPHHLIDQIKSGNVVIFAGAGISTENKEHSVDTLYQVIAHEVGSKDDLPFDKLMSLYCAQPDGRIKLVQKIMARFNYFTSFSDFYDRMTRFHRALSSLYMINDIVTTNWDDFFERECCLDAFINDNDMPLWNASPRKLMKIHGSIRNLGSIVATEDDYRRSFRRLTRGPMGAKLKALLSEKTFIYVGYSISDENYIRIARSIAKMTQPYLRQSYIVSPHIDESRIGSFPIPLTPIRTDGAFFLEQIRAHLEHEIGLIRDRAFTHCGELLDDARVAHNETSDAFLSTQNPLLMCCLSYQDGLLHGLQRIKDRRCSGEYHDPERLHRLMHAYIARSQEYLHKKDYWNSYYAEGYQTALLYLHFADQEDEPPHPPLYGFYGEKLFYSLRAAMRVPRKSLSSALVRQARRYIDRYADNDRVLTLIPDHTPYL
jgi:hypothetical protein